MDQTQGGTPEGSQSQAPVGVSEEKVAEIVNRAISARNKLFEQQISKQLDGAVKGMQESLKGLTEQLASNNGGGEGGKRKKGDDDPDNANTLKVLQRKISDLEAENQRVQQTAAAEKAKSRDQALRQKTTEALADFGVKDTAAARRAMLHLIDGEKRISFRDTDDDTIVYRDSDDTVLDLAAGLKAWTKSEDGKFFLPPTGARGSGDGRGGSVNQANGQGADRTAFWNSLAEAVLR